MKNEGEACSFYRRDLRRRESDWFIEIFAAMQQNGWIWLVGLQDDAMHHPRSGEMLCVHKMMFS